MATTYEIKLPEFEGPFDLLLFFIERDELNIYDVPLAHITNEFLNYIHQMRALNIEVASEFILVASKLMHIKARTLLPKKQQQEEAEAEDPRQELLDRLIEYKKYKNVISDLQYLEKERQKLLKRGNVEEEVNQIAGEFATETELHSISLYKLLTTFQSVMKRFKEQQQKVDHKVIQYPYTIQSEKKALLLFFKQRGNVHFKEVLHRCDNKMHAVFSFLAILELIQQQLLAIENPTHRNDFRLLVKKVAA